MVATMLNGFGCLAQLSVAFEMQVHMAIPFKAGEATVSGLINSLANLLAFAVVMSLTSFLNNQMPVDVEITYGVFFIILSTALLLMANVKYH